MKASVTIISIVTRIFSSGRVIVIESDVVVMALSARKLVIDFMMFAISDYHSAVEFFKKEGSGNDG